MSESYPLISAREHYLSIPVIENFCRYLACYLNGRTFAPAYTTETLRPKVHYCFVNLEDAYEQYMAGVADFAEKASGAGIIVVLRLWNRGHDGGRNARTFHYLRERLEGEWAENTRGIRIHDKLHLEWGDRFEWPDEEAPVQGDEVFCWGLKDHFGILCDGTVVPCCLDSEGVIDLGNVLDGSSASLADILSSPRAQAMVKGFECRKATEELCRRCGYAQRFV